MAQESESRTLDKVIVRLPHGMRERIKAEAEANNRSMNAEIVATLELAYPAPVPFASDPLFLILLWRDGEWRSIDENDWTRFRAGQASILPERMREGDNYIIVLVLDESDRPCNIIVHNYRKNGENVYPAHWDLLSEDEHKEYNRLMLTMKPSKDDDKRIRELQDKMDKAFIIVPEMVSKLRDGLINLAPSEIVDSLLSKRIKVNREG